MPSLPTPNYQLDFPRADRGGGLLQQIQQLGHLSLMTKWTQSVRHRRHRFAECFGAPAHLMLRSKHLQQLSLGQIRRQKCHSVGQRWRGDACDDTQLQLQREQAGKSQALAGLIKPTPHADFSEQTVQVASGRETFAMIDITLMKQTAWQIEWIMRLERIQLPLNNSSSHFTK